MTDRTSSVGEIRKSPPTAREEATDFIREQILTGRYPANTRVPQEDVATSLGISRIPVREAIVVLECEGVLSNPPNRGAYVLPVTRRDIRAQFELRGYALGMATRNAAQLDNHRLVENLEGTLAQLRATDDPDDFLELSWTFNELVTSLGGTPKIRAILGRSQRTISGNFFEQVPRAMPVTLRGFTARVRALKQRDGALAVSASVQAGLDQADCLIRVLAEREILTDE